MLSHTGVVKQSDAGAVFQCLTDSTLFPLHFFAPFGYIALSIPFFFFVSISISEELLAQV